MYFYDHTDMHAVVYCKQHVIQRGARFIDVSDVRRRVRVRRVTHRQF